MFNILLGSSTSLSNAASLEKKLFIQTSFSELHCFKFIELNPANNTYSPKEAKEGFLNGHN